MEVVHRRVEEEEVVVVEEEQLLPRRRWADLADPRDDDGSESSDDTMNGGYEVHQNVISDEKSVYFDKNEDAKLQWAENNQEEISKLVNDVINHQNLGNFKDEILSISTTENVRVDVVEESDDEEVIELEFERAVDKVHTHTPYCPNCSNRITKVVLRRKKRTNPRQDKPLDLLGCLSCFSIFVPSGDCLNPFGLFRSKPKIESPKVEAEQPSIDVGGTTANAGESKRELESPKVEQSTDVGSTTTNAAGAGNRLNVFNLFGSKPKLETPKIEDKQPSTEVESTTTNAAVEAKPEHPPHVTVDLEVGPETYGGRPAEQPLISGNQRSKSLEILKCIVYGGLIESIASLSIVSSAAASDSTTLNVVVIGLATLFSGLIAFVCNLVELRNNESNAKYEELLGKKGHFVFHSTFAIFSYLIFGLVAPITYGFAFRESDNKDYKIIAVAAAAFACIFILAIDKAYVKGTNKFGGYVKTILYYVTLAVSASGVAYAAGDLFGILLDNLGWFQSPQDVAPLVSAWASY